MFFSVVPSVGTLSYEILGKHQGLRHVVDVEGSNNTARANVANIHSKVVEILATTNCHMHLPVVITGQPLILH